MGRVWRETKRFGGAWTFPPKKGSRVGPVFSGESVRIAPFDGHFMRYEGEAPPPGGTPIPTWRRNPAGWVELWPREPLRASTMDAARELITPLLPLVEDGSMDDQLEKRIYQTPTRPERVREIEHPAAVARAVIVKHHEGHYEIHYGVYAPNGHYFPASTPSVGELEWEWGVAWPKDEEGNLLRTLADELGDAERIAMDELDEIVRKDLEIKRRPEPGKCLR